MTTDEECLYCTLSAQAITLNVAFNSYNKALLTILISNNVRLCLFFYQSLEPL